MTDPLEAKNKNARGQGQGLRTQTQVFSKKNKERKVFKNFFPPTDKILTIQKYCCPRAEDTAVFEDLRLRGQGLDLRGHQNDRFLWTDFKLQGHQKVSSRTSSRPRTSSSTPPLVQRPCFKTYKTTKTFTLFKAFEICSQEVMLPAGTNDAEMGPPTRYTLWCNAASIMKDFNLI